jgi:hypothetical protein
MDPRVDLVWSWHGALTMDMFMVLGGSHIVHCRFAC